MNSVLRDVKTAVLRDVETAVLRRLDKAYTFDREKKHICVYSLY